MNQVIGNRILVVTGSALASDTDELVACPAEPLNWRNIAITLKIPPKRVLSEMAWFRQLAVWQDQLRSGATSEKGPIFPHTFPNFFQFWRAPQRFDFLARPRVHRHYNVSAPSNACCDPHDPAYLISDFVMDDGPYR
jgi:hypothetical protein